MKISKTIITLLVVVSVMASCQNEDTSSIVTPTSEKMEQWADMEIGVMFHYDVPVFDQDFTWTDFGTAPDPSIFNPTELSTDQWLESASKMGAKYAVLTAKHCSGFCLWPTKAHDYNISKSPWKNGEGDLVRDFIESCKKYNIKPSIYCSPTANCYFHVGNDGIVQSGSPTTQEEYPKIVEKQYEELWSNYGDLFEIWFDGGVIPVEKGGPDIFGLLCKLQPNTVGFQAPKPFTNRIRWVGNEKGDAPDPCWATDSKIDQYGKAKDYHGDPFSQDWNPGETDFPLRSDPKHGGWFWTEDSANVKILTSDDLITKYEHSVGRNTNMLVGLVVDPRGLVPEKDIEIIESFHNKLMTKYGTPYKQVSGKGKELAIDVEDNTSIDRLILQEDIHFGERVLEYVIKAYKDNTWETIAEGTNIGHKRIITFNPVSCSKIKIEITSSKATPIIKNFSIYKSI